MDRFINMKLIANPYNWVIVISFSIIGALLLREVGRAFETGADTASSLSGKVTAGVNSALGS